MLESLHAFSEFSGADARADMNIKVEEEDLTDVNLTSLQLSDGSGYVAQPSVFHELHCIVWPTPHRANNISRLTWVLEAHPPLDLQRSLPARHFRSRICQLEGTYWYKSLLSCWTEGTRADTDFQTTASRCSEVPRCAGETPRCQPSTG